MANKKYDLEELRQSRSTWPEPVPENTDLTLYNRYLLKKHAVDMYIDGLNVEHIQKTTGIYASRLCKLVDDCIRINENGQIAGYCGLIKKKAAIDEPVSNTQKEFSNLLEKYPSLKDFIAGNYFGDKKYTLEKNMNSKTLHGKFLVECRRIGIMQHEYPFTTINKGYVSLCKYLNRLAAQNLSLQAKRMDKDSSQKLATTGQGTRYSTNSLYPFSTVQIDGHIIDMVYTVEIMNEDGTISDVIATRAWLIAVIDVATRCILGYSLSQEFNYNQYDVMDAIKDAIIPKELKILSIPELSYPSNGGYYSTAFPELKYILFDSIMLDNAKSHLSSFTIDKLVHGLKCTVNYGSVATPETRGIVERFFQTLEKTGFHKLPMTTGSSPKDLKRNAPEKQAIKYHVTYDQISEIMDVLIADYNNSPHTSLDNLTPLECMFKKVYEAGMTPCIGDDEATEDIIKKLNYRTDMRIVRGRAKNGKRAYIQFMGVEYRSRLLSLNEAFVNKKIRIIYDPRDISSLEAFTEDGNYIDTLTARGEFGTKSHSVKTRKNVMKLARERGRQDLEFDTPIEAYMQHLQKDGRKSRRSATKSDIVRRETGRPLPSDLPVDEDNIIDIETKRDQKSIPTAEEIKDLSAEELYHILFEKEEAKGI